MPYKIQKVKNKDCYEVINIDNKKIHAKCSTLDNAKKQIRLLHMIDKKAGKIPDNIIDKDLYLQAKEKADEVYKRPSAYKSAYIQKEYKKLNGRYKYKTKGLKRWFDEKWIQVIPYIQENKIIQCGEDNKHKKACRPLKKINKNSPETIDELINKYGKDKILNLAKEKNKNMNLRINWEDGKIYKGGFDKINFYNNNINNKMSLRTKILEILNNVSEYEEPQDSIILGGTKSLAKIANKKEKAKNNKILFKKKQQQIKAEKQLEQVIDKALKKRELSEWQKCLKKHGRKEVYKYYDKINHKCNTKSFPEPEKMKALVLKPKAPKRKNKSGKPLTQWQECVSRYGVQGAKNMYNKEYHECDLSKPKNKPKKDFCKYVLSTPEGKKLFDKYQKSGSSFWSNLVPFGNMIGLGYYPGMDENKRHKGKLGAQAGSFLGDIFPPAKLFGLGLDENQKEKMRLGREQYMEAYDALKQRGMSPAEARHAIKQQKKQSGGDWFDDFSRGFMLPIKAAATLAPLVL